MKLKLTNIFQKKKSSDVVDNSQTSGFKRTLSKISGAFMLPISVMAIAGLFLGVGAAIESHVDGDGWKKFGTFIKNMGDPVFGAMPILFAAAIAIAFTEEAGVAVFATIIAYMVFNALQTPFIEELKGVAWIQTDGKEVHLQKILFSGAGRDGQSMAAIVGKNLGVTSMNTSVFGGIIVGATVAYLYNRFSTITLHPMLSFFAGKRFVSLISIVAMVPLSLLFLVFWPWIGKGFAWFGENSGKVGYGVDSLIFGYIERALIPFGLHHVFYSPLWWTSAGGTLTADQWNTWLQTNSISDANTLKVMGDFFSQGYQGDQTMWINASGLSIDKVTWLHNGSTQTLPVFEFIQDQFGYRLGRFMQGKYSFMIFALPAAGVAMIMAAPKENRKVAASAIVPAALTSFTTGVTEPIEFTFLFLAPAMFWGFHAIMAAISFMLMNLVGAHIGMTFSGGIIDMGIYGMAPMSKGTNFWWAFVFGAVLAPIYFFAFYYAIKKFDWKTPGRGGTVKLMTKKDFRSKGSKSGLTQQTTTLVEGFGGYANITRFSNCATRLRYDIKDKNLVDKEILKQGGALGVMFISDTHVQVIMGPVAEQINNNIKANKNEVISEEVLVAKK